LPVQVIKEPFYDFSNMQWNNYSKQKDASILNRVASEIKNHTLPSVVEKSTCQRYSCGCLRSISADALSQGSENSWCLPQNNIVTSLQVVQKYPKQQFTLQIA